MFVRHLTRLLRIAAVGGALVFGLGCMGLVDDFTDLDIVFQTGDDATHPEDFPVPPPAGATQTVFLALTTTGESVDLPDGAEVDLPADRLMRTETVTYENVPADALDRMAKTLRANGFAQQDDDHAFSTWVRDDVVFVIAPDGTDLVLIRVKPVPFDQLGE